MQIEFVTVDLRRTRMTGCVALCTILLAASTLPAQQEPAHHEKLGNVHFPISCGADAQRQFDRALAMLHSFWFPQGLDAFAALTTTNPDCAMAYWGIAISARANPLVGSPDSAALGRGWQAVEKAKAADRLWPMRELLGELLLMMNRPAEALRAFELSLKAAPNRFRGFYGAAKAAERMRDRGRTTEYYQKLVALCSHADSDRPEITEARAFLARAK